MTSRKERTDAHQTRESQGTPGAGAPSAQPMHGAKAMVPPAGQPLDHVHGSRDDLIPSGVVDPSPDIHVARECHATLGVGDPSATQPRTHATASVASAGLPPVPPQSSALAGLRLVAEMHWDCQKQRIAATNRIGSPDVETKYKDDLARLVDSIEASETLAKKMLIASFKREFPHLVDWANDERGVGIPTVARLIGVIGSPAIAYPMHWPVDSTGKRTTEHPEPLEPYWRTLRQLWSYCGWGDAGRRRRKGMSAADALGLGSPKAKTIVYLIAEACVKQKANPGKFRHIYDDAKASYMPAVEAGELALGHAHNRAVRIVAKEILRDLWLTDRAHHGLPAQVAPDGHRLSGGQATTREEAA